MFFCEIQTYYLFLLYYFYNESNLVHSYCKPEANKLLKTTCPHLPSIPSHYSLPTLLLQYLCKLITFLHPMALHNLMNKH